MPIVADLARAGAPAPGISSGLDRDYCTPSRSNAGTPNATLTPAFVGEIIFDTTNKVRWKATTALNTGWRPMEAEVT